MLKKIRLILAGFCLAGISLLFLDISGTLDQYLAFLAKIQLLPALIAGGTVTVAILLIMTFLIGRVYCSILCPLGIFQDVASYFGKKNRFRYTNGKTWLRIAALVVFGTALLIGIPVVFGTLEPYSAFGRVVTGLFAPIWTLGNNTLAYLSEQTGFLFIASSPIWIKGISAFILAALTFIVVGYMAVREGRTWCNTLCPAGTVLGCISKFSLMRPRIAADSCTKCGLCEKVCKASCIDSTKGRIDASRCVSCFNCVDTCQKDAIKVSMQRLGGTGKNKAEQVDMVRRGMLATALGFLILPRSGKTSDMNEEPIPALTRKPRRTKDNPIVPPGAGGVRSFSSKCTGCQLCVSTCPNQVLTSYDKGSGMLQPALTFERGYCRVNCVRCSTICPAGAIRPITVGIKAPFKLAGRL